MASLMRIGMPGSTVKSVGFDSPVAMLEECHRRVEFQCDTLGRLVTHLERHGSDRAASEAAEAVIRYFEQAAPKHHADEEHDLFPALLESTAGSDAARLHALIDRLQAEHVEIGQRWRSLRDVLRVVSSGRPALLDAAAVHEYAAMYARHIACEEQELLPLAQRLLSDETLTAIGESMRARRIGPG